MKRRGRLSPHPIPWLPIDSRLIAPFISFGHVKGYARMFLIIEIVLSVVVVVGTFVLAIFKFFNAGLK